MLSGFCVLLVIQNVAPLGTQFENIVYCFPQASLYGFSGFPCVGWGMKGWALSSLSPSLLVLARARARSPPEIEQIIEYLYMTPARGLGYVWQVATLELGYLGYWQLG